MLLSLIFSLITIVSAQTVEVNLNSSKTLIFEFETMNDFVHLKSFKTYPENINLSYFDVKFLKYKNQPQTELETIAIDFVKKNMPLNERLSNYTSVKPFKWTEICEKIGQKHTGQFTDINNQEFSLSAMVGEKSSRCFGRCGFGCGVPFDNKNRYTQECLNHDLCNRELGENMGPCKDEYWAAADGYLNAKICEKKPK